VPFSKSSLWMDAVIRSNSTGLVLVPWSRSLMRAIDLQPLRYPVAPLRPVSPLESDPAALIIQRGSTFPRLKQLTTLEPSESRWWGREPREPLPDDFSRACLLSFRWPFCATCGSFSGLGRSLAFSARRKSLPRRTLNDATDRNAGNAAFATIERRMSKSNMPSRTSHPDLDLQWSLSVQRPASAMIVCGV
jgi:hypothetical protein